MEDEIKFTVEHIKVKSKPYITLVYNAAHFIYMQERFKKGWYCLETGKPVIKKLQPILAGAMQKVAEALEA